MTTSEQFAHARQMERMALAEVGLEWIMDTLDKCGFVMMTPEQARLHRRAQEMARDAAGIPTICGSNFSRGGTA